MRRVGSPRNIERHKEDFYEKRIIAFILEVLSVLSIVGCGEKRSEPLGNVLKAWKGYFSERKLKTAIKTYRREYVDFVLGEEGSPTLSFETDFDISECSIGRLSNTHGNDIDAELDSYIDL